MPRLYSWLCFFCRFAAALAAPRFLFCETVSKCAIQNLTSCSESNTDCDSDLISLARGGLSRCCTNSLIAWLGGVGITTDDSAIF